MSGSKEEAPLFLMYLTAFHTNTLAKCVISFFFLVSHTSEAYPSALTKQASPCSKYSSLLATQLTKAYRSPDCLKIGSYKLSAIKAVCHVNFVLSVVENTVREADLYHTVALNGNKLLCFEEK